MDTGQLKRIQQNLQDLTIEQISDLLVERTLHLLELLEEKNTDSIEYAHTKLQVKNIQEIIRAKKAEK